MISFHMVLLFQTPLEGVLGLSWAFALPFHDVIAGTAVDYMHCICEGT